MWGLIEGKEVCPECEFLLKFSSQATSRMRHGAPLHLPCPADRPIKGEGRRGLPRMTGGRTTAAATSVRLLGARHDLLRNSVLSSPSPDETCIGFLSFFPCLGTISLVGRPWRRNCNWLDKIKIEFHPRDESHFIFLSKTFSLFSSLLYCWIDTKCDPILKHRSLWSFCCANWGKKRTDTNLVTRTVPLSQRPNLDTSYFEPPWKW